MKESARYVKLVEWSNEDNCYVGSCPGLLYGGCHGGDEFEVFRELYEIAEETIALYHRDDQALPPPTAGRDFANRLQDIAWPLHTASQGRHTTRPKCLPRARCWVKWSVQTMNK